MAINTVAKFNWEKLLSKVDSGDVKRSINILRAKANELTASSAKFGKNPEEIDFNSYKKKLKFTSSAVDALEAAYKNKTLPTFHAELPAFEAKKRSLALSVVSELVASTKQDLVALNNQLSEFENIRISKSTNVGDLCQRFPQLAREIEEEIKNHNWQTVTK